ncbi:DUF4097 family beta strand repeat-containing protein [Ornithinimicrobium cryptoxanthini]|uniref:DUF4097 domain-containing protein n=1 Tax=Ornithinimicrobium cryptoxanthini TaxID=2934161 RepID=A0ABY4YJC2_9MICO|nr:DUF4097 family beta strand repeat-containing protein [Ornithinimicrobium cryptoxanthini]USQ76900.1 DUF4097 domain-containing protein [Ornithinimicrobium cryptoxanthini]
MDYTFETPHPPELTVEIGSGRVEITAGETNGRTLVTVTGKGSQEATVEQRGSTVAVIGPRSRDGWFSFGGSAHLDVRISAPRGSAVTTKLGSADLIASGVLGACSLRSGSGDNQLKDVGSLDATSGSGNLDVTVVNGEAVVRSGSGDIRIGTVTGDVQSVTGSGDLILGSAHGAVTAKSGSGDVRIDDSGRGAGVTTASGDVTVGRLAGGGVEARTASGDVSVQVRAGLPVWTDIHSLSGDVRSGLQSLGQPAEGDPYVELRLRTVSGDIAVAHLVEAPEHDPASQHQSS